MSYRVYRLINLIFIIIFVTACSKVPGTTEILPTEALQMIQPYPQPTSGFLPGTTQDSPYPGITNVVPATSESEAPVSDRTSTPVSGQPPTWLPQPGDENLKRSQVFIDSAQILSKESYPVQYTIEIQGSLPTPCHLIRAVIPQPEAQSSIRVEIYSLVDPAKICIQVLESFHIALPIPTLPSGTYSIWINDIQIGEIKP
jgi:hypothetical protein